MVACVNCNNPLSNLGAGAQFVQCEQCAFIYEVSDSLSMLTGNAPHDSFNWVGHCIIPEGTRYISDGHLMIHALYAGFVGVLPGKTMPVETFQRLLNWKVKSKFGVEHMMKDHASGNYLAPFDILLNGKYINYLTRLGYKEKLLFLVNAPLEPVVLADGDVKIGALMPVKSK